MSFVEQLFGKIAAELLSVGTGAPFTVDASGDVSTSGDITLSSTGSVLIWDGDTGLSRISPVVIGVGNGTHGDKSGQLDLTNLGFIGTTLAGYVLPDVGGTAGWVMLGTWVAASAGDSIGIKIFAGAGFNTNANGQFIAEITSRTGNDIAAPNLDGLAYRVWGGADWQTAQATTGFAGVKFVATGSSTSPTNRSWDIWISVSAFSPGCFTVAMDAGDTFTYSGTTGSDPGSAAYIVAGVLATEVTGTIYLANLNWTGLLDGTVAGNSDLLQLVNSNAATSLVSQGSPAFNLQGSYWNGSASANDIWTIATSINGGTNGNSTLVFEHSGSSGGAFVEVPNLLIENPTADGAVALAFGGASGHFPTATFPDNSGTVAELNLAQTWSASQTFNDHSFFEANVEIDNGFNIIGYSDSGSTQTFELAAATGQFTFATGILTGATPTVSSGQVGIGATTSASASAGAATLPANPVGFLEVNIGGTIYKLPYYAS